MGRNILLEEARLKKGWSLEQASQQISVHRNTLGSWERGKRQPQLSSINELCRLYDATPNELGLQDRLYSKNARGYPHRRLLIRPTRQ